MRALFLRVREAIREQHARDLIHEYKRGFHDSAKASGRDPEMRRPSDESLQDLRDLGVTERVLDKLKMLPR